jgi:prepilin-type N-terminal cleavage/methylation domain-containing protein
MTDTVNRRWEWTMTLTKQNRLRARPGFSLMEMLIVVILIGIVMSVAGVRVSGMMTQQRVIRAAGTIQTQMETAFALAGRNREPMKIVFATSASAITVKTTNRAGTTAFATTDLKRLGLSNGNVTASSNEITVFPNGFASDTLSVQVSVTRNGILYRRIVRMSRAGLVKVI